MPFTIRATPHGVNFEGTLKSPITDHNDLQEFARLMGDAWKEHLKLRPQIVHAAANELENLK
jgi:hypothetical protein